MSAKLDKNALIRKANQLRIEVIKMLDKAGSGHVGGPLGMADLFAAVYYNFAQVDPAKPEWADRDYILLSNGHICPIWYAVLADLGYFDKAHLDNLRKIDSLLQGHPMLGIPGVENSSGPLGHGLSQAVGIALGLQIDKKQNKVICFVSDGEQQEGQTWEAAMSAAKWKLSNLVAIMDCNGIQIEGTTEEIMPLGSLREKYESFGWTVIEVDGHEHDEIDAALSMVGKVQSPLMIIAHTVAGKNVSFMENKWQYHDWKGLPGEADKALKELAKLV